MKVNKTIFTLLLTAALSLPFLAVAQTSGSVNGNGAAKEEETVDERAARLFEDPLRGVVVNRTITVQGQEFYQFFSMCWSYIAGDTSYTLSVQERPSARWGIENWAEVRRVRVCHVVLHPMIF